MPLIQVNMLQGRPPEKKEQLIEELTWKVAEILECPKENIRVMINEMPPEHWGIAGESVKKRRAKEEK
ncbi:2-hydroxymuconate tautomerase [Bacillus sp. REN10]|uniref:2-hydroxymuconate tautomerase n=1 Tax=Bacillus sp. REN10 TaxID=2782541 RepID=UPI00193C7754|nr:2-hydroxymuconate tautomerase [Bacillus sp. REN10]